MTLPRPELEIAIGEETDPSYYVMMGWAGEYNSVLEKPRIIISEKCPENLIARVISHEIIHWVLHKHLGEDICHLFDRIAYRVDSRCGSRKKYEEVLKQTRCRKHTKLGLTQRKHRKV